MRILMISDFYRPFVGGVEQHVRSLSAALAARRHSVAVATLQPGNLPAFEHDGAVRVHRLAGTAERASWLFSHPGRPWAPPVADPELLLGLRRVIARERPDVVHGHDWLARSFLPLKRWSGAPLVQSLHYYTLSCAKKNLMYQDAPCSGPGLAKCLRCAAAHYGAAKGVPVTLGNWAMGAAERAAVDLFVPVSHATALGNGLVGGRLPYEVIPNFVPDDLGAAEGDAASYVALLPAEGFFMFVGDLRPMKGLDVLLRAYAGLRDAPPLVLIGKIWPDTPAEFPPNVVVLKNWPNHAVMAAWRRCLAAVVPSVWPEPFGIVVIEAMASGRPVVGSRIGGIPDLVADGETGLLVPPGDAEALRAALARLLADPDLCARMGLAARQRAELFRAGSVVPRIERAYADVLMRPTAPETKDEGVAATVDMQSQSASAALFGVPRCARHTEQQKMESTLLPQAESARSTGNNADKDNSYSSVFDFFARRAKKSNTENVKVPLCSPALAGSREWEDAGTASSHPLVSIIINNYNYGRFLAEAIDSALGQTYQPLEVIVVDDGSADESRDVIARYGDRIRAVLKPNGGQASCFNAGFAASRGAVVLFLDADDRLRPHAATRVVEALQAHPGAAKLHYRLALIDEGGVPTGALKPARERALPSGDLRRQVLAFPDDIAWQPTSGNAFVARVLREVLPMPEPEYRICADYYLSNLPPLFGEVVALDELCAEYRVHALNNHHAAALDLEQTRALIIRTCHTHRAIKQFADALGLGGFPADPAEVRSVTFVAHRMTSLRLDSRRHPLPRDRRVGLLALGWAAAWRRFDLPWPARLAYMLWFLAMALAPRPMARWLAGQLFFPPANRRLEQWLGLFEKFRLPGARRQRLAAPDGWQMTPQLGAVASDQPRMYEERGS